MRPIQEIRRYLNEALAWINRIVTLDGLLQRVMLLRSLWRDIGDISRMFRGWRWRPLSESEWRRIRERNNERTLAAIKRDTADVLTTGGGNYASFVAEWSAQWGTYIRQER